MKKYLENLYNNDFESLILKIKTNLINNKKQFIITANPETMMNKRMEKILLDKKNTVVADSIGIIKACKMLNIDDITKIPGIDIAKRLLELGNDLNKSIVLFGATKEVNNLLVKKIKTDYPNLKVVGSCNGYVDDKESKYKELLKNEPDIIMVALGIPNQELLIDKYYNNCSKGIFIGVGGSLDVLSGSKKRAPKLFLKTNTEWLYRIIREPKRIKRFYQNNIKFIKIIKKECKSSNFDI